MARSITYSCNVINRSKKNKLKQDDNGYYEIVLGAFNIYNSEGKYYPLLESVSEMFSPGGSFRRRLDNGACRSELGHPAMEDGQSIQSFIQRVLKIEPTKVCAHIASVTLNETKDEDGKPIVLTIGRVKPSGPYADALKASLENVEENVAFSIRSLAADKQVRGRIEKHVSNIITYDAVVEPGIHLATKYATPSLEELAKEIAFTDVDLRLIANKRNEGVSLESASEAKRILTDLGWVKAEIINPDNLPMPRFLDW